MTDFLTGPAMAKGSGGGGGVFRGYDPDGLFRVRTRAMVTLTIPGFFLLYTISATLMI